MVRPKDKYPHRAAYRQSAAYYAVWAAADDSDELPLVASLAKAYCSEAYFHVATENIQVHGASASPGSTTRTCTTAV